MRRILACASLFAALATAVPSVQAAEPAAKSGKIGQYVDMSPVGVPVIWHGRLVNYVFVTLRLIIRPGLDAVLMREKEPYFRDALVRLSVRVPLNAPKDLTRLDDGALRAKMMAEAARIVGPGVVTAVQIVQEVPQRRTGVPTA